MTTDKVKIQNAHLGLVRKAVWIGGNMDTLSLVVTFTWRNMTCNLSFDLEDTVDLLRAKKLMEYTKTHDDVKDMNGKDIRIYFVGKHFRGFGHPVDDKLVPAFTAVFQEVTEAEFKKMLNVYYPKRLH